jgi:hypothetical protein
LAAPQPLTSQLCVPHLRFNAAARVLGFTPQGPSPWAGLALALHDTRPNS